MTKSNSMPPSKWLHKTTPTQANKVVKKIKENDKVFEYNNPLSKDYAVKQKIRKKITKMIAVRREHLKEDLPRHGNLPN